jgi:phosphate transport system permease protein
VSDTTLSLERAAPRTPLGAARPRWGERIIIGALFCCAVLSVIVTVGIVIALLSPTIEFFREVSIREFLTGTKWSPLFANPKFGVLPLVVATLVITVCALAVAVPCGLGTAIYLSEYARPATKRRLKPALEVLAGIPTVVYGFFAIQFISPYVQDWWPIGDDPGIFNGLSAGIVMGLMIIPTIASLSEDAMSAVPQALREGAYALASTKREVATRIVVPAALSGIVASIVLAVSRALGETMIVLIAAGGTPNLTWNPGEAMQTMTAFIGAAGIGDQPTGSVGYKTIFAVGSLLFIITLVMNALSIRFVRKFRETYE